MTEIHQLSVAHFGFWNGVRLSYGFGPGSLGKRICGLNSFMGNESKPTPSFAQEVCYG